MEKKDQRILPLPLPPSTSPFLPFSLSLSPSLSLSLSLPLVYEHTLSSPVNNNVLHHYPTISQSPLSGTHHICGEERSENFSSPLTLPLPLSLLCNVIHHYTHVTSPAMGSSQALQQYYYSRQRHNDIHEQFLQQVSIVCVRGI